MCKKKIMSQNLINKLEKILMIKYNSFMNSKDIININ